MTREFLPYRTAWANAVALIEIPLERMAGFVRGAIIVARTSAGILPLRLPEWAWSQVPDALTGELFRMSAGVRLALTTEATALEVDVAATRMSFADFDFTAFLWCSIC